MLGLRATFLAGWRVDPLEEIVLEPLQGLEEQEVLHQLLLGPGLLGLDLIELGLGLGIQGLVWHHGERPGLGGFRLVLQDVGSLGLQFVVEALLVDHVGEEVILTGARTRGV